MTDEQLNPDRIIETVERLARRIEERFPKAGLNSVCGRLVEIARRARVRSAAIARPSYWLRLLMLLVLVMLAASIIKLPLKVDLPEDEHIGLTDLVTIVEAGSNVVVLSGAAIFFLFTIETRFKRRRALGAIHELRVIAHIIDMHQLTKDPERMLVNGPDTASSPQRTMTAFELNRYLDYCSEMLALIGKVATLYVQEFEDSVAVQAVNDVESLTTGLSRKIWQKITMLHAGRETNAPAPLAAPVAQKSSSEAGASPPAHDSNDAAS